MATLNPNTDTIAFSVDAATRNSSLAAAITQTDTFSNLSGDAYFQILIAEENWNQTFPFQLRIVDADKKYATFQNFSYTLPISPQELTIQMPFAVNLQATLNGISEDHAGAPFRIINITATTGVVPSKGASFGPQAQSVAETIFAGTLGGINEVKNAVNSLLGNSSPPQNLITDTNSDDLMAGSTGFFHHQLLQKFLESYAFLKKQKANQSLRLAFCQHKTESMYLVTPIVWHSKQDASSPLEYKWNLQLKAWKRVPLDGLSAPVGEESDTRDQNFLAQTLQKIQDVRDTLQGLSDVISGFNQDIQRVVFEPLREAELAISDAIGISITAAALPANIIKEFKTSVVANWDRIRNQIDLTNQTATETGAVLSELFNNSSTSQNSSSTKGGAALDNTDPLNNIFNDPVKYNSFFRQITPTSLNLSTFVIKAIEQEKIRVRNLTRTDFETRKENISILSDNISNILGLNSTTYNNIYNIQNFTTTKTPTDDDWQILFNLNNSIIALDRLLATFDAVDNSGIPSALNYVAGLATKSGMAFQVPTAKLPIPMPYGITLEQLAAKYLGDSTRWLEIVTLNGLREPYIDEVGFTVPLLFNGNGHQITVSDATNLFINQNIYLYSNILPLIKYTILSIKQFGSNFIITLDGDTLEKYKVLQNAALKAYLPSTVNSQMMIFVPTTGEPSQSVEFKKIPTVTDIDGLLEVGGIDLLLTQSGDLVIGTDGHTKLAFGLNNLVQSVKLALTTPQNTLLDHPTYGLGVGIGSSTADIDAKAILKSALNLFSNDRRFSKVLGASISKSGPTVTINISVQVAATNHILPISVQI